MLLLTRVINIEWIKTLRDSVDDIQFLEPATVLDIQTTARLIERWNSNNQPARLMRTGRPLDIQSVILFVFQQLPLTNPDPILIILKYQIAECMLRSMSYYDNRQRSYNWYNANSNCYFWSRVINIEWEKTLRDSFNNIQFLEPATAWIFKSQRKWLKDEI